jgi:hypothetical protein
MQSRSSGDISNGLPTICPMNIRNYILTIFGLAVLPILIFPAHAQMSDQGAREQGRDAIRSHMHFEPSKFLQVQKNGMLEQLLAEMVARPSWSELIYNVSEEGNEIKEHTVIHHIVMDGDPTFTIAINPASGNLYRIRGFTDSLDEFNRLITEANTKILTAYQAEAVANFYREVNPEKYYPIVPLSSLLDLKQTAERQCQAIPFDPNDKKFDTWWKRAKPLYQDVQFKQTTSQSGGGYAVEWIALSSTGPGMCGGAPLRARLEVSSVGHASKLTFSPLKIH